MEWAAIDLYDSFSCLAGDCPDTCCAGWRILVDGETYQKYRTLLPTWLREEVLSGLRQVEGRAYFRNDSRGRCVMLDVDGLCRIQRNSSEEALCNTCRKYPRLIGQKEGVLFLSMAASCPVVAQRLLREGFFLIQADSSGKREKRTLRSYHPLQGEVWKHFLQVHCHACRIAGASLDSGEGMAWGLAADAELAAKSFGRLSEIVRNVAAGNREGRRVLDVLETLQDGGEPEFAGEVEAFCRAHFEQYSKLRRNYLEYRIFSRRLEYPEESVTDCLCQVQGELLLIRLLAFAECRNGGEQSEQWRDSVQLAYRFCAHGKKIAERMHQEFVDFFVQEPLWHFVLS